MGIETWYFAGISRPAAGEFPRVAWELKHLKVNGHII